MTRTETRQQRKLKRNKRHNRGRPVKSNL